MKTVFTLMLLLGSAGIISAQSKHTISGYVREKGSGETLIGVVVYRPGSSISTTTNTYGFYSITLPASDSVTLAYSYLGYRPELRRINLKSAVELNIDLVPGTDLQQVEVVGNRVERVSESALMSTIEIPIAQIKNIPALLGEKDVMKVLQLMPGVQKGSEGNSGIYVRGGGPDQNLIILDDATVYNANHLFGFFSLFNGDAIKSVELTKGGFPARYGGRLSSVIDLNMKDGNKEELHGEGGIGLISSRLMLEGPLKKGKSSFLVSGRRTYGDILIQPFFPDHLKGGYYFYDFNAKLNYDFDQKNKLYLSGYFGKDKFYVKEKLDSAREKFDGNSRRLGIDWGNATGTLRWNHLFNDRLFSNTSLIFSRYRFNISMEEEYEDDNLQVNYFSGINDLALKYDMDFLPNPKHAIKAGFQSTFHRFTPSAVVTRSTDPDQLNDEVDTIDGIESAVYIEDTWRPRPNLRFNAGLRLSHFAAQHKSYFLPEPRFGAAYNIVPDLAVKVSYARMNQYVHLLTNTGIGLPTDLWVPTTDLVAPQSSQQVAMGFAKDFLQQDLALTVEGYYKKSDNIIGYKEGASFLIIDDPTSAEKVSWEENVTAGQGWSYGVEFLLQKKAGRFSGWAGYTLSWTQLQFDSLNFGQKFYARYDRRHDISLVGIYQISDRITFSGTWVYGTGNSVTIPLGYYSSNPNNPPVLGDQNISDDHTIYYGDRNSYRLPAYHRMDMGLQFHKKKSWGERTWEVGLYNAYSRRNPFFLYLSEEESTDGQVNRKLKQVTLFSIIPSVSWGFKF